METIDNELETLDFFKEPSNIYAYSRGLDNNELREIIHLIETAKKNDNLHRKVFPDFICDNGWIEHFEVTCGPESEKKGSLERRQEAERDCELRRQADEFSETVPAGEIAIQSFTAISNKTGISLENYEHSFQKNWKKHIDNYHKKEKEDWSFSHYHETGVFMVESHDAYLQIEERCFKNRYFGNLAVKDHNYNDGNIGFEPIFDPRLLDFMEENKDIVQYVLFKGERSSCVLKTSNIPIIREYLQNRNYEIHKLMGFTASSAVGVFVGR